MIYLIPLFPLCDPAELFSPLCYSITIILGVVLVCYTAGSTVVLCWYRKAASPYRQRSCLPHLFTSSPPTISNFSRLQHLEITTPRVSSLFFLSIERTSACGLDSPFIRPLYIDLHQSHATPT